jgi:hypothetical protein
MIRRLLIAGFLAQSLFQPAHAAVSELSQSQLRKSVKSADYLGLAEVFDLVIQNINGEIVDVRAFDADGLCYRALVMLPDGKLGSFIIDAATGEFLAPRSERAILVSNAAANSTGKKLGLAKGKGKGKEKSNNKGGNGKGKGSGKNKN